MARGTPDGGYQSYSSAVNQSDLGSVSDRLLMGGGSVSRTGRVIWATGFEGVAAGGFPQDMSNPFAGSPNPLAVVTAGQTASSAPAWQGLNFLLLQTNAGGANSACGISKRFPSSVITGKWGLEFMVDFDLPSSGNVNLDLTFTRVPGAGTLKTYNADIRINFPNLSNPINIQYMDASGTFQNLFNLTGILAGEFGLYNYMKLIVDPIGGNYGKFIYNNRIFDLSNIPMQAGGTGVDEASSFQIILSTLDSLAKRVEIDNIILTADEP